MAYADKVLFLTDYLHATNAEQYPDHYASLRHALFLTGRMIDDEPLPTRALLEAIAAPVSDDPRRITIQEFGWADGLHRGG